METSQPSSSSDPLAPAAAEDGYPRWVMLVDNERHRWDLQANTCPISTDVKTVAHARTSNGHLVRASFRLAAPPAVSHLNLNLDDGLLICHNVVAADGDSALLSMSTRNTQQRYRKRTTTDHFVYRSGDSTDRLPSLSLLPRCYVDEKRAHVWVKRRSTGILRHGDEEFVVATILKINIIGCEDDSGVKRVEAEFHELRSSEMQWKTERLPVRYDMNKDEVCFGWWETDRVIPVADRFFYWVDLYRGIIISDICEESPELRFVPLPVEPMREPRDRDFPDPTRNLWATDGGTAVKFVEVSPRCCCGGPGVTTCAVSCHAFTVATWTLRLTQGGVMGWEKDGVVDSGEMWGLDAYRCLPCLPMKYPVVSIDDPDVICFLVSEHWHIRHSGENKMTWVIMINTRTKSLVGSTTINIISSIQHYYGEAFLPSQISSYFNTSPGSLPASERRSREDIRVPRAAAGVIEMPPAIDYLASPDQEVLAALQEIPGLTRDEILRAYGVLACDDRRRYRSLVALPMNMRKDYCCMLVDMGTKKCSSCSVRLAAATGAL